MRVFLILFCVFAQLKAEESFKIAVLADCQYCNQPDLGKRMYKTSDKRLKQFVKETHKHDLEFAVQLGDLIDKDYESFEPILNILKGLKIPLYHVLGNHDFSVSPKPKSAALKVLGLTQRYYSLKMKGYRFVILDGNDLSFHAYEKGSKKYLESEKYYRQNKIRSPRYNGAIGEQQITWLKTQLKEAEVNKESVVLFCHFPVFPQNNHNLWNADQIVNILEKYPNVKAYINGHNHKGNYAIKKGIHYLTLKGMVENKQSTFSIFQFFESKLTVQGFGAEENRQLELKK